MRRREFLLLVSGALFAPTGAAAQEDGQRRLAILLAGPQDTPDAKAQIGAFQETLERLGWPAGKVRYEVRSASGHRQLMSTAAQELIQLRPHAILAVTTPVTTTIKNLTQSIPVVFINVSDPVGDGIVASLARPGGNITGFINVEASMAGKWLELLREVVPGLRRVAVLHNPDIGPARGMFFDQPLKTAASSLNLQLTLAAARSAEEVETAIKSLSRERGDGLIVLPGGAFARVHQQAIRELSFKHSVPTIYSERGFVRAGGLLSYGPDYLDLYRGAAGYMDRILRGVKPRELPVQVPSKFELVINLKTAKTLGLDVPLLLQQRADEIVE